jgi:hypothetical protein
VNSGKGRHDWLIGVTTTNIVKISQKIKFKPIFDQEARIFKIFACIDKSVFNKK